MKNPRNILGTRIEKSHWEFPEKTKIVGQYICLEPLTVDHHADLWTAAKAAPESFDYLRNGPFEHPNALIQLLTDLSSRSDQPFWAVIDPDGTAHGWLSICDVYQSDGAFEIGSIWFAPLLQGTRGAREAIFLLMCLGMDTLDYGRLVWRCQAQNKKSFQAALNLGFQHEGTWRNATIIEGWQRDIAWYSNQHVIREVRVCDQRQCCSACLFCSLAFTHPLIIKTVWQPMLWPIFPKFRSHLGINEQPHVCFKAHEPIMGHVGAYVT